MDEVGIGIVGYGMMGRAHAYGYTLAPRVRELAVAPRLRAISGRDADAVARAAGRYGVDEWTTDWRALVARPDVDIVDVCTPPGTHAEIVEAAAAAGKAVLCEKPLAADYASAQRAAESAQAAGVPNAIGFNYRKLPAPALLAQMVAEGAIGDVLLWRAVWLSDEFLDAQIPFDWRFDRRLGASTIADLGAHLIDLALWIVGEIDEVAAQSETFTRRRSGRAVDVDEASACLVRFAGGARGTFELARVCARRPCDFFVEVNGTRGTLRFEYPRLNELWFGEAGDDGRLYGMRRIRAEHPAHPYAADWWPIGQGVGYGTSFVNQAADLLERWPDGPWEPDLAQGARVQAVCEAMERAAADRRWVRVAEVTA
ncbi:MAG: Gfo/Idh/MocA family oxidoreductase [Thermoleophilia bacterium]|nr:Gfo/Idh/MocA family oxidoreductase [Thermoleophilia bacterium]